MSKELKDEFRDKMVSIGMDIAYDLGLEFITADDEACDLFDDHDGAFRLYKAMRGE